MHSQLVISLEEGCFDWEPKNEPPWRDKGGQREGHFTQLTSSLKEGWSNWHSTQSHPLEKMEEGGGVKLCIP